MYRCAVGAGQVNLGIRIRISNAYTYNNILLLVDI